MKLKLLSPMTKKNNKPNCINIINNCICRKCHKEYQTDHIIPLVDLERHGDYIDVFLTDLCQDCTKCKIIPPKEGDVVTVKVTLKKGPADGKEYTICPSRTLYIPIASKFATYKKPFDPIKPVFNVACYENVNGEYIYQGEA